MSEVPLEGRTMHTLDFYCAGSFLKSAAQSVVTAPCPTWFRVSGFGVQISGFGFRVARVGFRVPGFGFSVPGSGFGLWVVGLRVEG